MRYKIPVTVQDFENVKEKSSANENENGKREQLRKELEELSRLAQTAVSEAVRREYGAEYMKGDDRSDEELSGIAEESAKKKVEEKNSELMRETEEKTDALGEKAAREEEKLRQAKKNIEDRYDMAKQNASDDALKRGVGRSSVIVNLLKEYDGDKMRAIGEKEDAAASEIKKINDEIDDLNGKLKSSLEKSDMLMAFEINEKLTELKAERDKANEKALRYNNSLAEKLAEYRNLLEKSDTRSYIIRDAKNQSNDYYNQMIKKIVDYYSGLSEDEIKKDFENGRYDELLSPAAYKKLKTFIEAKHK